MDIENAIVDIGKQLAAIRKEHGDKLDKIQTSQTDFEKKFLVLDEKCRQESITLAKHDDVIYGDPRRGGEGGLLYEMSNVKRTVMWVSAAVGLFISTTISGAIGLIFTKKA